jgi:hypothetical protein
VIVPGLTTVVVRIFHVDRMAAPQEARAMITVYGHPLSPHEKTVEAGVRGKSIDFTAHTPADITPIFARRA